jgi:hypothetical protein
MIHRETTGEREFHVPFADPVPGAPFEQGELVIETAGPADHPKRLAIRFFPSELEFMARVPNLIKGGPLEASLFEIARTAERAQPAVVFEAAPEVVAALPDGLRDLPTLERFLAQGPNIFDLGRYQFASIEFELKPEG